MKLTSTSLDMSWIEPSWFLGKDGVSNAIKYSWLKNPISNILIFLQSVQDVLIFIPVGLLWSSSIYTL